MKSIHELFGCTNNSIVQVYFSDNFIEWNLCMYFKKSATVKQGKLLFGVLYSWKIMWSPNYWIIINFQIIFTNK